MIYDIHYLKISIMEYHVIFPIIYSTDSASPLHHISTVPINNPFIPGHKLNCLYKTQGTALSQQLFRKTQLQQKNAYQFTNLGLENHCSKRGAITSQSHARYKSFVSCTQQINLHYWSHTTLKTLVSLFPSLHAIIIFTSKVILASI